MELTNLGNCFRGKTVLVTGHTGFKGSWLTLWLTHLGAKVVGFALPPETKPSHWELLELDIENHFCDIRDFSTILKVCQQTRPEFVFHLAAQPLVRRSYREPLSTWSTNVLGTANLLEACRHTPTVRVILVVTTDKCYENKEWVWGYRESDSLGGYDPYSASKASTELVASSYRSAFFQGENCPAIATARAGNVIGGGDWSEDRLIPDLARAITEKKQLKIRSPRATRPWQHVLECLHGYLRLAENLDASKSKFEGAWNFGPDPEGNQTVATVLSQLKIDWPTLCWETTDSPQPHEANLLYLDSSKSRSELGWKPIWNLQTCLRKTAEWYRSWLEKGIILSQLQLLDYIESLNSVKSVTIP